MGLRSVVNRRSIAGWVYLAAASCAGVISSTAVLARLPAAGSGLFFLCQSMMPFLLLFDMGLLVIGTREIAFASGRESATGEAGRASEVLRTYLRFRDARAVALYLVGACTLVCGASISLFPALRSSANAQALLLTAIASGFVLSSYAYQSFLEGTGNYHLDRFASAATVSLSGLLVTAAAFWTRQFWWVLAAWYVGQAVTVGVKAVLAHRVDPGIHRFRPDRPRAVLATFRQSFSLFIIQCGAALTKYVQYPIIASVLGVSSLGTYFFVVRIASTVDQAISVLNSSQRAIFSQLYAAEHYDEARHLMLTVLAQVAGLAAIGGAAVVIVLPMALRLLTHHDNIADVPFWVLGLDLVSMCVSGMMTQFVIASGRNPFPKAVLSSGVLTVGLLTVLIPRYGLLGAALGQFVANAITNLWLSAWYFTRLARLLKRAANASGTC